MREFTIRNSGTEDVVVEDLGVVIEAGTDRVLTDEFSREELDRSEDLSTLVSNSTLTVVSEGQELPPDEGVDFLEYSIFGMSELKIVDALPNPDAFRSVFLQDNPTLPSGMYICNTNGVWVMAIEL